MATITVLGAGMMGSAWCVPLLDAGHRVLLVGTHLDNALIEGLTARRHHLTLKYDLPAALEPLPLSELPRAVAEASVVGLGVSSAGIDWAAEALAPHLGERPVMLITKGLEWDGEQLVTLPDRFTQRLSEAAARGGHVAAPGLAPVAVAGPCIAGELARKVETCVVMAGRDPKLTRRLAAMVRTPYYHAFPSDDVVGVEVCAALKNAYAMGIAFGAGLHQAAGGEPGSVAMHNHESAVFAQASVEMLRLVTALGGEAASVVGLAGVGDLDVTCNGGRTGRFGRLLGAGHSVSEAVRLMEGATLECLAILEILRAAVPKLEQAGALKAGSVPLLMHLWEVALQGAPVKVPFPRCFAGLPG